MNKNNLRMHGTRLVVTNAIASAMLLVYGRSAYAGTCVQTAPGSGVWVCSGAAGADVTQPISGNPVTVTTTPGFGISTAAGNALAINATGGLSFTDTNASTIFGSYRAIEAVNNGSGNFTITSNGNISSGATSIVAWNLGTGLTSITTSGTVNSANRTAIYANSGAGTTGLEINSTDLTGGRNGIISFNNGTGATSVTTTGTITGTISNGIYSRNNATTTDLTINAANVNAGQLGIFTRHYGVGETNITATGTVTGTNGWGIYSRNNGNTTDLTINAVDVSGGQNGIDARNFGTGETSITATGTVSTTGNIGIYARNTSTNLTINAVDVSGGQRGISAVNFGTGETSITTTGAVTGASNIGIYARNTGTNLTIDTSDVTGGTNGIYARNFGMGATNITSTGTVSGTNATAIDARNYGTDLTITAADVSGGIHGMLIRNYGNGTTEITATGTVTGTVGYGIYTSGFGYTTGLTVTTADVAGGSTGIFARNSGPGATIVTSIGTVTGTTSYGITATSIGTDLTVTAIDVTGGQRGIVANNFGSGATSVTATGTVTGTNFSGIDATNFGTGLTVLSSDVTGRVFGIDTHNYGIGATTVTSTGAIVGTYNIGIRAVNGGTTTDLTIFANDVTGGQNGIVANNAGFGATTISTTGTVTGTSNIGIAGTIFNGNGLTISANNVTGGETGIYAQNFGNGATTVSATGAVVGTGYNGIDVLTVGTTTDLNITAVDVTGGTNGIEANNAGTGATTVLVTGTVSGIGNNGIDIQNTGASTTDLTIMAIDVSGGSLGIGALNGGNGSTNVTSTGTVTGGVFGVFSFNGGSATDLTITTNNVVGSQWGIAGFNYGTGETIITSTGAATATSGAAIYGQNGSNATDLTINSANVAGGQFGIAVSNGGTGATTITSTGTATGTGATGIDARTLGTDIMVNAASVSGGNYGVFAINDGTGATTITSTGTVTGTNASGILATASSSASDITITAADVTGGEFGISARNYGVGATTVTSSGTVTGTTLYGILALNTANTTDLIVTAANVTGGASGILAVNFGTGATTVSVSGTIAGDGVTGINTLTDLGSLTTINLAPTAVVGATSGNAILNNNGDSIVNVAAGATINGAVRLSDGDDTINISGVNAFAGITVLDGGDDVLSGDGFVDNLNLNGWTGNLNGALLLNWEFININGGTVGFSNAAITAGQINVNNFGTFNGSNNLAVTGNVAVASGSNLIAGNAAGTNAMLITGNLTNFGNVRLTGPAGQQAAGDRLNVTGNYVGTGGTLVIDTVLGNDASVTDRLVVAGSTSGSTGLFVNNVGGLGAMTTGDGIMVVDVTGASAANAFSLVNNLEVGAFNYFLYQNGIANPADGDWYLRTSARGITGPAMMLPDMGNKAGLSMLGSLQERLGVRGTEMDEGGAWIRIVGNSGSQTHRSTIGDFHARNDSHFVQAGVDFLTTDSGIRFGAFAATTQSNARVFDLSVNPDVEAGRAHLDGYAVGAYATQYGDNYYWDAVIQHAWLDATASGDGDSFTTDNKNLLASFEFGRAFTFANNHALEPQAQIIIGKGSTDSASDGVTTYNYEDEDVLLGRLGVRWTHAKDQGTVKGSFVPYVKANVWHNFGDDSRVVIGPADITTARDDTWAEVGFGFSVLTKNNWSMFLQYDYERGVGDSDLENHTGTLGLRRSW